MDKTQPSPATQPASASRSSFISHCVTPGIPDPPSDIANQRHDGWTPERRRIFLVTLAKCGVVDDAARAAGMSRQTAYALRNRAEGRAFHLAWNGALQLARRRINDDLMSRAIHGCVELIVRDGQVVGERHRFDNRLTMAVLTRLDQQFSSGTSDNTYARLVAEEFDEFLDIACTGGEAEAAEFFDRGRDRSWTPKEEQRLLHRLARYRGDGAGRDALEEEERKEKERGEDAAPGDPVAGPATDSCRNEDPCHGPSTREEEDSAPADPVVEPSRPASAEPYPHWTGN